MEGKEFLGIKVVWDKTDGASEYEIYRKESGQKWERLKSTSKIQFTDKTVEDDKAYSYKVRAILNGMTTSFGTSQSISTLKQKLERLPLLLIRKMEFL